MTDSDQFYRSFCELQQAQLSLLECRGLLAPLENSHFDATMARIWTDVSELIRQVEIRYVLAKKQEELQLEQDPVETPAVRFITTTEEEEPAK